MPDAVRPTPLLTCGGEERPLSREERLRRVVLLCSGFSRNFAYYRAAMERLGAWQSSEFWRTVCNNFLDQAVLEWCKLFVDRKWNRETKTHIYGEHHWRTIVRDPVSFQSDMLNSREMNEDEFADLVDSIKSYRNTFVAHLDTGRVMHIPSLGPAFVAVRFYHAYVVNEVSGGFRNLPNDPLRYLDFSLTEARKVYVAMS